MKDFSNAFSDVELPQQQSSGGGERRQSDVDWDAFGDKQIEVIGAKMQDDKGTRKGVIGVITNAYELGTQEQDEQTIPVDSQDYANHEWRLEKYEDSGQQKDPTAKIEERWYKKKKQECLVYTPPSVKQFALAVDFPEIMFPYGEFFEGSETKPLRVILGKEGFIPKGKAEKAGTRNLIAKPFNLKHVNVNRGKDGAEPHYALAKNGKVVKIAGFAEILDENGNFHAQEVGKFIGKAVMCDLSVEVQRWESNGEQRSKVVVDAEVVGSLGPRDVPFYESDLKPLLSEDLFGFVLFEGDNDEETLKILNGAVINTMKLSPEFGKSKLAEQLEKIKSEYTSEKQSSNNSNSATDTSEKEDKSEPDQSVNQITDEPNLDFDDN